MSTSNRAVFSTMLSSVKNQIAVDAERQSQLPRFVFKRWTYLLLSGAIYRRSPLTGFLILPDVESKPEVFFEIAPARMNPKWNGTFIALFSNISLMRSLVISICACESCTLTADLENRAQSTCLRNIVRYLLKRPHHQRGCTEQDNTALAGLKTFLIISWKGTPLDWYEYTTRSPGLPEKPTGPTSRRKEKWQAKGGVGRQHSRVHHMPRLTENRDGGRKLDVKSYRDR